MKDNIDNKYLLSESVEEDKVKDAIIRRKQVRITYDSGDGKEGGKSERIIQPVALGHSRLKGTDNKYVPGNLVVRAFQPFGDTKTKVPHWKLFRLDKITNWKTTSKTFQEPPGNQYGALGKFNENGDNTMFDVIVVANFKGANDRYKRGGLEKYNQNVRNKKVAENPYYDLEKQTRSQNKVMVGPDAMKEVNRWKPNADMQKYLNGASAEEMARTTNFGDDNSPRTTSPIVKNNTNNGETYKYPAYKMDYKSVANNGPVYKGQENDSNTEDNENNEENKQQ